MYMDDIKLFARKWKRIGESNTNNKNIQLDNRNGIWHGKISYTHNQKWKKTNNGRNKTAKLRKKQNTWRKGKLQVIGNIGNEHHQTNGDERKILRVPQTSEKAL